MHNTPPVSGGFGEADSMDPKLVILIMLIAAVVALSHLSDENLGRMRRQLATRRWRAFVPSRRRS